MDASESLRGYAGDSTHNMHPDPYANSILTPGSYTFLTGAMESPLKDQPGGGSLSHEDGVEPQSSNTTSGNLIGTLFTNHQQLTGSFTNASRSPPVPSSSNSWELTINRGSAGSLYAGGSNVNMPNILINGSGMMAHGANSTTPTAQLLIGGLHGGSFSSDNSSNDHGGGYYPGSQSHHVNPHAEAMQLIYVNNGGFCQNGFHPDGRAGTNATALGYPPGSQEGADQNHNHHHNSTQQSSYGVSFLTQGANMSQRALEAAGAIPLVSLHQDRHHGNNTQSFSNNWQRTDVGNEHSFLPVNEDPQGHHSLFGAALAGRHGDDLSHMHGREHLQSEVECMHVENQGNSSNNISVNGQGLLSLSLSSHQPHFQGGQLPGESTSEAQMVAQLAKTKELASRYIASTGGANADLSRFRTPSRDDVVVMGSRFHHEQHVTGHSTHRKLAAGSSGSSNGLTASQFLQSVQTILNELCKVTPMKRTSKPASSTEQQQFLLRTSSASVNAAGYGYHGKEDAMHAEASTGRGEPASSVGSLNDAANLVTVSHIPGQVEMMSEAHRASGASRDDLEFKKGQLIRMLDEVEARFRRYRDQLQFTCAGFNAQAGPNAASPYTILALQAMSRHFRCLKDAVKNQLKVVRRALGEEDAPAAGINGETSRLRYVDQQIRQQRALQQLGMLQQHAWRPQRGLPERAVSVLRAWLFEHFLHPYPKDVDKMSLAKQTGLTRSQVSNWFINARVRLWKPMVEEMYVEEQREAADLVLQGERMVREQANLHNSPYEHYEGNNNRGRTLQDVELHANGGLPDDYRSTQVDESRDLDQDQVGSSVVHNVDVTEVVQHAQALYRQQDMSSSGELNFGSYENAPREAKRSKTALETVSDTFHNNTSSMLVNMHPDGENHHHKLPGNAAGSSEGDTDLEARKLKGKAVTVEHSEHEAYGSGAFVSYNNDATNNLNHVHRSYEAVAGYVTSRAVPAASSGVSLTLGLRHCDANMRSSTVSVAPILEKYDLDVDITRMDPLDREEYLHEGRIRGVNCDNGQYEMQQREQQEENHNTVHLTREILPGGTGMANQAFEHHHEFHDGR